MFERLAKSVERHWKLVLILWGVLVLGALGVAHQWFNAGFERLGLPYHVQTWKDGAEDGEFGFLPPEVQSLAGEGLLARAFPEDLLKSSVVIVVRRWKNPLTPEDERFIEEVIKPRLEKIRDNPDLIAEADRQEVLTFKDQAKGRLLVSEDKEASLVILPLKSEFLQWSNKPIIKDVEELIYTKLPNETQPGTNKGIKPPGLDLAISGSATVGRDMLVANDESGKATERWTLVLVVLLLVVIYRSPFLWVIPLLTVMVSVTITLATVILLTAVPHLNYKVFYGMDVYITVVAYGTGVDYCLFLIARYKEELDKGLQLDEALTTALGQVGAAVTASAGTVICGIGMMVFAQFGKFQKAGIGISLGLIVGLLASLTLTPALLRMTAVLKLWPRQRFEKIRGTAGRVAATSLIHRLVPHDFFYRRWEDIGRWVLRRPGSILTACVLLMFPFAAWGMWNYEYLSYGLLSDLPATKKSVIGAKAVQEHFPAGYAGPLTVLIENYDVDFNTPQGSATLEGLLAGIERRADDLGIADIRYLNKPLGINIGPVSLAERVVQKKKAPAYYISKVPGKLAGHVTRVDIVFQKDPFDRESIQQLNAVENAFRSQLSEDADEDGHPDLETLQGSEFHFVGPTASIRDLKKVTDHDQIKIDVLVLGAVFLILVVLLKKPAISAYLIVSVFFSYFVALGMTFIVFRWLDPENFSGLDWKVPMFLFTILIAIGEDYNIFLMTRIEEEQEDHGLIEGVRVAMLKTGTIISSCGIIMAGTFMSLLFGSLVGLKQLGFALAFGVLLDTFVVRPLLVPAYLVLLYQGRFGRLGKWLGGAGPASEPGAERPVRIRAHADA